jgi:hypothetical protein
MEIYNQFTYTKAGAITAMFERWLGERPFQAAAQEYLRSFAWKAATTGDFLDVVSRMTGRDVAPAWKLLLDTTGVPVISANLDCSSGQGRLLLKPLSESRLPLCFRAPGGTSCTEVAGTSEAKLPGKGCPTWVIPNAGGSGYYRVVPDAELLKSFRTQAIPQATEPEIAAVTRDTIALTNDGELRLHDALLLVPALARDKHPLAAERLKLWLQQVRLALPEQEQLELSLFLRHAVSSGASKTLLEAASGAGDASARTRAEKTALDPAADPEEILRQLIAAGSYEFVMAHYEELEKRLSPELLARLPRTASGLCSEDKAQDIERFFGSRAFRRELPAVLRTIRGCARLRQVQSPLEGVVPRGPEWN